QRGHVPGVVRRFLRRLFRVQVPRRQRHHLAGAGRVAAGAVLWPTGLRDVRRGAYLSAGQGGKSPLRGLFIARRRGWMRRPEIERWRRLAFLLVAAAALLNGGCAVVAVGACAAAGGAAGYAYYRGSVSHDYAARPEDVRLATRTALAELDLKV